jgi:actin related protein 2/3 complex subunit 1A/1B
VTGIDWAHSTNKIVTCSQDRNAYVWTEDANGWQPSLVILRLTRGCTCVKWSPKEDKFAVGSAALAISICYWDAEGNWYAASPNSTPGVSTDIHFRCILRLTPRWVSRLIKGLSSTALCLSWHPNNFLLAVGGTDNAVTVFSAFVKVRCIAFQACLCFLFFYFSFFLLL